MDAFEVAVQEINPEAFVPKMRRMAVAYKNAGQTEEDVRWRFKECLFPAGSLRRECDVSIERAFHPERRG